MNCRLDRYNCASLGSNHRPKSNFDNVLTDDDVVTSKLRVACVCVLLPLGAQRPTTDNTRWPVSNDDTSRGVLPKNN